MAYKEKDTKKWSAQWFETTAKGEKKKRRKRGFETKREALEYERQKKLSSSRSMDMKLSEFMEVYFEDKQNELKDRTMKNKRYMMEQHIIPYFGEQMLSEITASQIIQWQNEMQTKGFSESYLRMIQNQLTCIFTHASRIYDLHTNPCKKVKRMGNSDSRSLDFWTTEEYQRFIQTIEPGTRYYLIFEILFWTGCRIGELLAICYGDINFKEKTVSITKTYYRRNKTDYITAPKTESSNRIVTMPDFLVEELKAYTDKMYELKAEERIFMVTDRAVQKKMKQKADKLNLKHIRVHDLRHSHIAFLIEKGTQSLIISKRVGHDSVTTTMNIYGHLYPDKQRQLADMLNAEATGEMQNNVVDMGAEVRFRKAGGW